MKLAKIACAISSITVIMVLLSLSSLHARTDELHLVGILKNMDPKKQIVTVDVKSSSCKGIRIFSVDNLLQLEDLLDQKISFYIDSNICKKDTVYKMLPGAEVQR